MKMMGSGMIVRLLLAAAAAVAGAAGPGSAAGAEVRNLHGVAVIIGNHWYEDRDIPPVDYARRDAEAFRRFVIDVLGFRPESVIHLENATRRQMADALGRPGAAMNDIQARLNMVAPDEGLGRGGLLLRPRRSGEGGRGEGRLPASRGRGSRRGAGRWLRAIPSRFFARISARCG